MDPSLPSSTTNIPYGSDGMEFLALHPFVRATVQDKIRGTIVGSALGDCIGLYTEFLSKTISRDAYPSGKFQLVDPATEFRNDGHRNKFEKKAWTDDTDHALLILLSYLHHDGKTLSSQDLAERLRSWVSQGLRCLNRLPMGLGRTVGSVVISTKYLENPRLVAYKCWINSNRTVAPNGSLMRTHPLGLICLPYTLDETFRIASEFSTITHADPRCVVACCISTGLIRGMLRGEILVEPDVNTLLEKAYDWVDAWIRCGRGGAEFVDFNNGQFEKGDLLDRDEFAKHVHANSFRELQLDDSGKIGYVYKCLGSAILALRLAMRQAPYEKPLAATAPRLAPSAIFENIVTELTYEAGDADTNACAAGALLGCWLGYNSLPPHWRDGMMHLDWMVNKCDGLSCILGITPNNIGYQGSADPETRLDGGKGLLDGLQLAERDREFMVRYLPKNTKGVEQEEMRIEVEKKKKGKGLSRMVSSLIG